MGVRRVTVDPEQAGRRLDQFLVRAVPGMTPERVQQLLGEGRVRIRGKLAKGTRKLWGGEELEISTPTPRALPAAKGPRIPVLYDDASIVIVDKPVGYPVEPEPGQTSIVELVATQQEGFDVRGVAAPGVVHRLDKDTTGCLALARSDDALGMMDAAFQEKRVDKRYFALVLGSPPDEGRFDTPFARDPSHPRRYTTRVASARKAALSFRVVERFPDAGVCSVEIVLETGRTHQIRVQFSDVGHPVLGDPLYGTEEARTHPAAAAAGRIALHARALTIQPATGTHTIRAEAPLPSDLQKAMGLLRR